MEFINYSKSSITSLLKKHSKLSRNHIQQINAAAQVFPMRANNYVIDNLIDWNNVPNDPIFKLVFPQPEMLFDNDRHKIMNILKEDELQNCLETRELVRREAIKIRKNMNPHPAKQKELNVPTFYDNNSHDSNNIFKVPGVQHKYRETMLFFPSEAQWCHSYCTYCFRWAQFAEVGSDQQFKSKNIDLLVNYIKDNKQLTDILFTGGDPGVMKTKHWEKYLLPIINNKNCDHLQNIRIGTKSLTYWPYRYTHNDDSKELLKLFEFINSNGKHVTIQAHFTHPNELETKQIEEAIKLLRMSGCNIRSQGPIVKHINDDSVLWSNMWNKQVKLGIIPYYMFMERDTGPKHYFEIPLIKAFNIFKEAYSQVSGIARTVRGPSMSCEPGKVCVIGVYNDMIMLQFLQARNPEWCKNPFFAKYNENASWINELKPYNGNDRFFYENELKNMENQGLSSGQMNWNFNFKTLNSSRDYHI